MAIAKREINWVRALASGATNKKQRWKYFCNIRKCELWASRTGTHTHTHTHLHIHIDALIYEHHLLAHRSHSLPHSSPQTHALHFTLALSRSDPFCCCFFSFFFFAQRYAIIEFHSSVLFVFAAYVFRFCLGNRANTNKHTYIYIHI